MLWATRMAVHLTIASLWVAWPSWQRRADSFGFWVGITVALCVQEKMGATLLKMAERFAGNSTAAAVAIIAAQVFLVRKWSSILVICIWSECGVNL